MTEAHAERAHSVLGASAAHCWTRCPGSVEAKIEFHRRYPTVGTGSEAAREGTEAHELCETLLRHPDLPIEGDEIDRYHDRAMLRHALRYREYCRDLVRRTSVVWIEAQVAAPTIHDLAWGTADFIAYDPREQRLDVVDYKYGQFNRVLAHENEQLLMYGEAARATLVPDDPVETVVMHVYQPRIPDSITCWSVSRELLAFHVDRLATAARRTETQPHERNPGKKQCRWCEAAPECKTYATYLWTRIKGNPDLAMKLKEMTDGDTNTITDDELAEWIERFDGVAHYARRLQDIARQRALQGRRIPGRKLVAGRPRYVADRSAVEFILGEDALKPSEVKSRSELIQELGYERFQQTVGAYFRKEDGFPMLVDESDPRSSLAPERSIADMFDTLD